MASVVGWYGHANAGDESYKLAFPAIFPNHEFEFTDNPLKGINSDCLILGGGDILSTDMLKQVVATKAKKKLIVSASASRRTPCELLKGFDQIFVRDNFSVNYLRSNGIECSYMPDIAFALTPNPKRGQALLAQAFAANGLDLYQRKVGVVLNSHLASMGSDAVLARDFVNLQKVTNDLAKVADSISASFVFFPMCTRMPSDDRITNSAIAAKCKFWQKNHIIYDNINALDTLDMISSLDAVISTRLHSTIFSVISGVPFLDLTHHDKNRHFLQTVGLQDYSRSYWEFQPTNIANSLNELLDDPCPARENLRQKYEEQREILKRESACVHID